MAPSRLVTTAPASSPVAPDEIAMATARSSALSSSDGRATDVATYVRPSRSRTAAPPAAWMRARDDRARVTSFSSSGVTFMPRSFRRVSMQRGYRLDLVSHPADVHASDAVAASDRRFRPQVQPGDLDRAPGDRHLAEVLRQQATHRVDVVVVDADLEQLGQVVDVETRAQPVRAVGQRLQLVGLGVVLVGISP